jgi:stalled ribosome rescue protein Dom34
MGKKIGIWMDKRIAKITSIDNENIHFFTILSEVDEFRPKGGSGTRIKGGPQNVVHDSKYLAREKKQLKAFFHEVAAELTDVEEIVVFGPADTGRKFADELSASHHNLYAMLRGVEKADSMTDNQVKAWVRAYFE